MEIRRHGGAGVRSAGGPKLLELEAADVGPHPLFLLWSGKRQLLERRPRLPAAAPQPCRLAAIGQERLEDSA